MMNTDREFEKLVWEAWGQGFSGWDFSFLENRMISAQPPWDYMALAHQRMQTAKAVIEIGTGGGELFSTLQPFPPVCVATESYPPNVQIAGRRLLPLGVSVVHVNDDEVRRDGYPFANDCFDLALNRHAGYAPPELRRILRPGGVFLTQQVGGRNCLELNAILQDEIAFPYAHWTLDYAVHWLHEQDFTILQQLEAFTDVIFKDIGAVVFYLKVISWQVDGFTPRGYWERLQNIHHQIQSQGGLVVHDHRFLIEARRPG
jgi:SAM-dependent methyltransferase